MLLGNISDQLKSSDENLSVTTENKSFDKSKSVDVFDINKGEEVVNKNYINKLT